MSGWQTLPITVPADHPTAAGHFPGAPVIPGALLLDEVVRLLAPAGPFTFRAVKFLHPAPQGTPLLLRWEKASDRRLRFEITRSDREHAPVVSGTLEDAA